MLLLLADGLLLVALVTAPLLYGAVGFFSLLFLACLSVLIFNLVYLARPWTLTEALRSPGAWLGIGLLLFIVAQLIPLPEEVIRKISPSAYQFYATYFPGGIGTGKTFTLSVYPSDTFFGLIQFLTYGLFFLSVLMRLVSDPSGKKEIHPVSHKKSEFLKLGCLTGVLSLLFHSLYDFNLHIPANGIYFVVLLALGVGTAGKKAYDHAFFRRMVGFVINFGFLVALFAIIQKFSYNGRIFWVGMEAPNPIGSYYNYDHYAGFMELCGAAAIGMIIASIFHTSFFHRRGLIEKVLWFSTKEANKALRYLLMSVVMVATIFMSTSRGGIMSFALSQIIFFAVVLGAAWRTRKKARSVGILTAIILLIAVMVIWLGPKEFLERFRLLFIQNVIQMEGPIGVRLLFYKGAFAVIKDFPWVGTGFNTFGTNFTRYRIFDYTNDYLRYTHNDYLQLISEAGAAGILFLAGFLIFFLAAMVRVARRLE